MSTFPPSAKALGKQAVHDNLSKESHVAVPDEIASQEPAKKKKKVAIIGSGAAGLGAAYALQFAEDVGQVHLFEKSSRLGGHTNTQTWTKDGQSTPLDTGFIVMNTATYPNFMNFLKSVSVDVKTTEMSFAVSRDRGKFEWSGSLGGIFGQPSNFFRFSHWRMILDILRFEQFAPDILRSEDERSRTITIGEYLDKEGYSQSFKDNYLIPMTAAVWSTSPDKASLEFPAQTLIRFMWNHHLLSSVSSRPDWLTIPGGAQRYIDAIRNTYPKEKLRVHDMCKVVGLTRPDESELARMLHWDEYKHCWNDQHPPTSCRTFFDHVIFACHGDQVLPILDALHDVRKAPNGAPNGLAGRRPSTIGTEAIMEELEVFRHFETTQNECYLHSDLSLMPTRRATWSSWNYLIESEPSKKSAPAGVSLTYNMNILQHIPKKAFGDVLVTMNPKVAPKPALTQGQYTYEHPLYTVEAVKAQERLEKLQYKGGVSYCGAWTKYGFHEDAFSSGLKVAVEHLGAKLPFEFTDSTFSRGHTPAQLTSADYTRRFIITTLIAAVQSCEQSPMLPGLSLLVGFLALIAFWFLS